MQLGGGEAQRARILVADDDAIFRSVCAAKLRSHGLDLIEAADGIEAWHQIKSGGIALALIDIDMPSMNGIALVQCIRGHLPTRHMPVVMITSHEDLSTVRATLQAGATAYLTKPVNWSLFADHIAHLLALGEARQAFEADAARTRSMLAAWRRIETLYDRELDAAISGRGSQYRREVLRGLSTLVEQCGEATVQPVDMAGLLRSAAKDRALGDVAVAAEIDDAAESIDAVPDAIEALVAETVQAVSSAAKAGARVRFAVRAAGRTARLSIHAARRAGEDGDGLGFALDVIGVLAVLNGGEVMRRAKGDEIFAEVRLGPVEHETERQDATHRGEIATAV